jgi:hypothetical protein
MKKKKKATKKATKKVVKKKVKKVVKKAVKVKANKVKSKKKKKVVKKTKRKKRRKKKLINMEEFYKILNKVQLKKRSVTFAISLDKEEVVEHIIKDVDLKYDKVSMKTQAVFTLHPNKDDIEYDMMETDYLDDEIVEEGQIFS